MSMDEDWKVEVDGLIRVRTCGWSPPGDHPVGCGMFIYTDKNGAQYYFGNKNLTKL